MMEKSPICNFLKVLSHRDVWKNNLMFKFNDANLPTHCVLVDFQTTRYLPISIDVLMAIICTTGRRHREENFENYLKFYYEQLETCLKNLDINLNTLMSFDDFTTTCEYHKLVMLIYRCILLMITLIPHEYHAKMTRDDVYKFCEVDKSEFVLNYMNEDEVYEKCLVAAVNDVLSNIFQ
jgi:Ecdysteroid kinase-like family